MVETTVRSSARTNRITEAEVNACLARFPRFREPEMQGYIATAVDRFTRTLNLLADLNLPRGSKVLEIGGRPYFMTMLMQELLGLEVHCANEPTNIHAESAGIKESDGVARLVDDGGGTRAVEVRGLNIEYDAWPWEDETFDAVVYCEVIEHLVYDPTHTLVEAHRVLKSDSGTLLLSTPNALCYTYLVDILRGKNPYPPYDGYSHYARHHRLFSPSELRYLCEHIGFEVHESYSAYDTAYEHPRRLEPLIRRLIKMGRLSHRLDVIYLTATPHGKPTYAYPTEPYVLYADVHGYNRIEENRIDVSTESPQLGSGFYPIERGGWAGDGVRWTAGQARLFLKRGAETTFSMTFYSGMRPGNADVRGWVELEHDGGTLRHPFSVSAASWHTVEVPLSDGDAGTVGVLIGIDNVFYPGEADDRPLGIALQHAELV
jgi:SAM-dependent methyltransferase